MARTLLLAATIVWLVAGAAGIVIGLLGATGIQRLLPPVTVDPAAIGGAAVAVAVAVLVVGVAHAAVVVALRAGHPYARSVALLLSVTMATLLLGLAVAAATSAATVPDRASSFLLAAVGALAGAAAYGLAAAHLAAEVRAGRQR
jgi:hypothetical protein